MGAFCAKEMPNEGALLAAIRDGEDATVREVSFSSLHLQVILGATIGVLV